jgi:hypothetical protein
VFETVARLVTSEENAQGVKRAVYKAGGDRVEPLRAALAQVEARQAEIPASAESWKTRRMRNLLKSALDLEPLRPLSSEEREFLTAETELNRMPLEEAFSFLCGLAPALLDVRNHVMVVDSKRAYRFHLQKAKTAKRIYAEASKCVGPQSRSELALVRTPSAQRIAMQFLLTEAKLPVLARSFRDGGG